MKTVKRVSGILLAVLMCLSIMYFAPTAAQAETSGDYEYTINEDQTVTITKYTGSGTSVTIPEEIDGHPVTSIGKAAFVGCGSLTNITIPESVTSIGEGAFNSCKNLTSITIPESVTSIGERTFSFCIRLNSITLPEGVTSIGYMAFYGCESLTNITIPKAVTSIGEFAFTGCQSLTSITIPQNVTSIRDYAFFNCAGLTNIQVAKENPVYDSRENCNAIIETASNTLIQGCAASLIPNSVTSIGESALAGCGSLTNITIPESVTSIGRDAFLGCGSLTNITIPNSVTSIGERAFNSCKNLTSITIPESVTSIGENAFLGCDNLVIYGYSNTAAERYAKDNGIRFMNMNAPITAFSDVSKGAWFLGPVTFVFLTTNASGVRLMSGYGDGTKFGPADSLTRGQFAVVLHRYENEPAAEFSKAFSDIAGNEFFVKAAAWAQQNNVISGYADGRFGGSDPITREQMAVILFRYAEAKGYNVSASGDLSQFTDTEKISSWAKTQIAWANGAGIISGKENKEAGTRYIDPQGNAARAECAAMLQRFIAYAEGQQK